MSNNVSQLYLFLLRGEDIGKALDKFETFVKDTGGNMTDDRDLFDQWIELQNKGELILEEVGVLYRRSLPGIAGETRAGVMTAQVVRIARELKSQTSLPPLHGY